MADDILDHHHGAIHHHAEVQRAQREQIGRDMPQVQADRGKQQRKRNGQGNDDRAADVAQKNEEDDDDQDHAFREVVQHRVGGVMHQVVAIEIRDDLHSGRQDVIVELVDHGVKAFQHGRRVRAFAEKHDAFDDVVIVLNYAVGAMERSSDLAQANLRPLRDHGNVFDPQRRAVLRFDHRLFDVAGCS